MEIKKLKVRGQELSEAHSYQVTKTLLEKEFIKKPEQAQQFIEYHKLEDYDFVLVLRDPDYNGLHFCLSKHSI
jgi:hypothetical protein